MEFFLINHRDPIYGLIIFVGIILIILISNYLWGIISFKKDNTQIKKLLDSFNSSSILDKEQKTLLLAMDVKIETMLMLANTFSKSGDFDKAINVYLACLSKSEVKKEREIILSELGKVYFKAGMLQRAIDIFLQSLKQSPRNKDSLKYLAVIYEKLKMYDAELEVLEVQDEQNIETKGATSYVKILKISNNASLDFNKKVEKILKYKDSFKLTKRFIMELFIRNNQNLHNLKEFPTLQDSFDLAWNLKQPINLKDTDYKAMFYAKKMIDEESKSDIFELNAFCLLNHNNFKNIDLTFSFICDSCKSSLPFYFYRCPMCFEIQTVKITSNLQKVENENYLPF